MSDSSTLPALIVLAGTSEAGKSTAGQHLARRGARRIKIRTLILRLHSGRVVRHEGVPTREGFDPDELIASLRTVAAAVPESVIVLESCIDAALVQDIKAAWTSRCELVFITAPHPLRVRRHVVDTGLTYPEADQRVRDKDSRKRVAEQIVFWRRLADHWITNDEWLSTFTDRLDQVMTLSLRSTSKGPRA